MNKEVQKLNKFLIDLDFDKLRHLMIEISDVYKANFEIVNLDNFTVAILEKAKADKARFARMQYFEKAAVCRDTEINCIKYLGLKNQLNHTNPTFIYDEGDITLLYFHDSEELQQLKTLISSLPEWESEDL